MDWPSLASDRELRCARHPSTPTYLRCSNCGTPICPRCQVITPVGSKCPDCARVRLNRAHQFGVLDALVGTAISVVGGVVLGLLASVLAVFLPLLHTLLDIFLPLLVGLAIAQSIRWVIPRKRSVILALLLAVGVVVAWVSYSLGDFAVRDPLALLEPGLLPMLTRNLGIDLVLNPVMVIFVGLGIWIAVQRLDR